MKKKFTNIKEIIINFKNKLKFTLPKLSFKNINLKTLQKNMIIIIPVLLILLTSVYYLNQDVEIIHFDNESNVIIMNNNYDIKFSTNLNKVDLENFEIKSSNEEIAKVNNNTIIPVTEGVVEITITHQNGTKAQKEYEIKYVETTSIEIKNEELLLLGSNYQLNIQTLPIQTSDTNYTYTSSNENIITIDENGLIIPIKAGSATIKVVNEKGIETSFEFVVEPNIEEIIINEENLVKVKNGRTYQLDIEILENEDYLKYLNYQSSDESVITIEDGLIKTVGLGSAVITISTSNLLEKTIEIEVYEEAYVIEYNQLGEVGLLEEYESKESIFYYIPEGKYQVDLTNKNGYLCSLSINYNEKIEYEESYTYNLKEKINFYNVSTQTIVLTNNTFILNTNDCDYKLTKLD